MNKDNYHTNLLMRYLYGEATAAETTAIKQALAANSDLRAELKQLEQGKRASSRVTFEPKISSLAAIMKYSTEATEPVESDV